MKWETTSKVSYREGLYFEEEDLLYFEHPLKDDVKINVSITYSQAGFGFYIKGDREEYLLIIDESQFIVYRKIRSSQQAIYNGRLNLSPEGQEVSLTLEKKGQSFVFSIEDSTVANFSIPSEIDSYQAGFYSMQGNTVLSSVWEAPIPQRWHANMVNTNGGFLRFLNNGIELFDSDTDAEIELQEIKMSPGTYYFDGAISESLDVFIFPSYSGSKKVKEKNILNKEDSSFTIEEDKKVNLMIRGKKGEAHNLSFKYDHEDPYVASYSDQRISEGSKIRIDPKGITDIEIEFEIKNLQEDYQSALLYEGEKDITVYESAIPINTVLVMNMDFKENLLSVSDENHTLYEKEISADAVFYILKNINAVIYRFIVTQEDDDLDVINQTSTRRYVPGAISGPIIVTDPYGNPLELSSSYRIADKKFIYQTKEREYFYPGEDILLEKGVHKDSIDYIQVYGIPKGATYNFDKLYEVDNIEHDNLTHFASEYEDITGNIINYDVLSSNIILERQEEYELIIIDYLLKNHYSINYDQEMGSYIVDIVSDYENANVLYDYKESGDGSYIQISPEKQESYFTIKS